MSKHGGQASDVQRQNLCLSANHQYAEQDRTEVERSKVALIVAIYSLCLALYMMLSGRPLDIMDLFGILCTYLAINSMARGFRIWSK